jgi:ribosomal protein L21E
MLGDALLVGLDSSIYLPKGEWVDYWNGRRYESKGQWVKPLLKGSEGGPLFVKSGSILPMQPVTSNLQAGLPVLTTLDVFPAKQGQGCLYEDDGTSFNYEKGQSAKTDFSCSVNLNAVTINVGSRTGKFLGMPQRAYFLQVHNVKNVKSVVVNERQLKEVSTKESLLYERSQDGWWYDANKHTLFVKPGSSWRFGYDSRGEKGDTERDSLYMSEGFFSEDKGFICKIGTEFTNEPDVLLKSNIQLKPDRIVVTANPPSRVSLIDFGNNNSWLPRKTTIFVELKQGDLLVDRASNTILLEVLDENGQLLRSTEKVARNGIVIFENEKYIEEKVRFKISSKGLSSVEVTIAKPPKLQGHE